MAFDLDEKFVRAAEEKLGCRLPESFRRAMLENNGGGLIINDEFWQLHPVLDQTNHKRISRTCNDLTRETESMQEWRGWPEHALAIGANGTGDTLLFLRCGSKYNPQVYEWSHETREIKLLADDFSQLERTE